MAYTKAGLEEIFWRVVHQYHVKLEIRHLYEALIALQHGFGLPAAGQSRDELLWLCQTLWARSEEEARCIYEVFRSIPELTPEEVQAFREQAESERLTLPPERDAPPESHADREDVPQRPPDKRPPRPSGEPTTHDDGEPISGKEEIVPTRATRFVGLGDNGLGLPHAEWPDDPAGVTESFVLTPRPLVLSRALSIAWRRYRRTLRIGPPVELDIEATVAQYARHGVITAPVLVPARHNMANLTVLIDTSTSMIPWRYFNSILIDSLRYENSQLQNTAVYFFNNVPENPLYCREGLTQPIGLDQLRQVSADSALLILSDAGAARGNKNKDRVRATDAFVAAVADFWHPIAWLNPMPRYRWANSSAEDIISLSSKKMLKMFEMTGDGLLNAVDYLRGYRDI